MSDEPKMQWWALATEGGYVKQQVILPEGQEPTRGDACGWRFAEAHKIDRPGDLMIEDFDPKTSSWIEHPESRAALDKRIAREGMDLDTALDRIEVLEAQVKALLVKK